MSDGFRRIDLKDKEQGSILLSVSMPTTTDQWGVAALLRGTEWDGLIRKVSGEALSHAVHGWATPLVRELGPDPVVVMRRNQISCALSTGGQCVGAGPDCRPGRTMPDCYEPPKLTIEAAVVVSTILRDLRSGRHVVVVIGAEFVLL